MIRAVRSLAVAALLATTALSGVPAAMADQPRAFTVQANPELQRRADLLLKDMSTGGNKVTYSALEAGSTPESLIIRSLKVTSSDNKEVTVETLEVRAYDWANAKEPRYVDMSVKNLLIKSSTLDKDGADNLKEFGFDEIKLNADLAYKIDDAEKVFDVSKLTIDVADFGEFSLRLKLTGITMAELKGATGDATPGAPPKPGAEQGVMGLLARLNIAGASIAFKDKGAVVRAVRAEAKKKQMTEQAAKAKMLEDLAAMRSKADDDVTREMIDAAIKFFRNPGEIALAANPPAPANVMMAVAMVMGNPVNFKQMMGLSVAVK